MSRHVRAAITLVVLCLLLVAGGYWGWNRLTEPVPEAVEPPLCIQKKYSAGDKLAPKQVVVSVLNAGKRFGLASRTMSQLSDQGFARGTSGNAPEGTKVRKVQIWTADAGSPAVQLLANRLGRPKVVERTTSAPGIVVVVGDNFDKPSSGRRTVKVKADTLVCGPVPSAQPSADPAV